MKSINELVVTSDTQFSTDGLERVSTDELKNKKLTIDAVHPYVKDDESRVMFRFTIDGEDVQKYTFCTAKNVVNKLTSEAVLGAIADGESIEATLYERPSKQDKKRTVYDLR